MCIGRAKDIGIRGGENMPVVEVERMVRQYWLEALTMVEDFARTRSGKIQKFRLREMDRVSSKTDSGKRGFNQLNQSCLETAVDRYACP
jgi:acyl-CoA synthetase (AMP-forming)/AMP-acid ligase II